MIIWVGSGEFGNGLSFIFLGDLRKVVFLNFVIYFIARFV